MHKDLNEVLNDHDSNLLYEAVKEATHTDFESISGDFNQIMESKLMPMQMKRQKLVQYQWQIVGLFARTIIHLVKKNAAMETDYTRGRR